jgi:hypothetical protein
MIAKLVFGPRSRRRLYAVRRLKVVNGTLARGPLIGIYQARSAEAAVRAARRDFPDCAPEILAAVDQVASLLAIGGEALVFPAIVQCPDGTSRKVLLSHNGPDQAFRSIHVARDLRRNDAVHFAAEGEVE